MKDKVLILGEGILGTEIKKQTEWDCISRKNNGFDITKPELFDKYLIESFDGIAAKSKYDIIINCIANTDTYSDEKDKHWNVNYQGVADLVDFCNKWNIKLIHISTDYIYANSVSLANEEDVPVHVNTWYGYTKLLSDGYVQLKSKDYLIIRTSHKPYPFPYKNAWANQITNGDYADVIAEIIIKLVNQKAIGVFNVGTNIKTWWDLTFNEFKTIPSDKDKRAPSDVSMSIEKLTKFLSE